MENLKNLFRPRLRPALLKPLLIMHVLLLVSLAASLSVFGHALHGSAGSAAPSVGAGQFTSTPATLQGPQAKPVSAENFGVAGINVAGRPRLVVNTMYIALAIFDIVSPYLQISVMLLSIFLLGRAVFMPGLSWGARIRRGLFACLVLVIGLSLPSLPYMFGGSGCGG